MPVHYRAGFSLGPPAGDALRSGLEKAWAAELAQAPWIPGRTSLDGSDDAHLTFHRSAPGKLSAWRMSYTRAAASLGTRLTTTVTAAMDGKGCTAWVEEASEGGPAALLAPSPHVTALVALLPSDPWARPDAGLPPASAVVLLSLGAQGPSAASAAVIAALEARLTGMAAVRGVLPAEMTSFAGLHPELIGAPPGGVAVLRPGHSPVLLPPTLVARQRVGVATRVQRLCLDFTLAQPRPPALAAALALPGMPDAATSGVSEDLLLEDALRGERDRLAAQVRAADLNARYDDLVVDLTEALEREDALARRLRFVEARLAEAGDYGAVTAEGTTDAYLPDSCLEALLFAADAFLNVRVTAAESAAEALDDHAESQMWAHKVWRALTALDDYARTRAAGEHRMNFHAFCIDPPPGASTISPGTIALRESESTSRDHACRRARSFTVPAEVGGEARRVMEAHIKIQLVGTPAPRMHFLDDSTASGLVVIGYLGPHLPTAG